MFMFYIPIVLLVIAAVIFFAKVKLSEVEHKKIVEELEDRLEKQQAQRQAHEVSSEHATLNDDSQGLNLTDK